MPDNTTNEVYQSMTFDAIKIGLASPEKIRAWATRNKMLGEVQKRQTTNHRPLQPETHGLVFARLLGPRTERQPF